MHNGIQSTNGVSVLSINTHIRKIVLAYLWVQLHFLCNTRGRSSFFNLGVTCHASSIHSRAFKSHTMPLGAMLSFFVVYFIRSYMCWLGKAFTNRWIGIWLKLNSLYLRFYRFAHNKILRMRRQHSCRGMCKFCLRFSRFNLTNLYPYLYE